MHYFRSIFAAGADILLLAGISGIIVLALLTYPYRVEFKRRRRAAVRERERRRREAAEVAEFGRAGSTAR